MRLLATPAWRGIVVLLRSALPRRAARRRGAAQAGADPAAGRRQAGRARRDASARSASAAHCTSTTPRHDLQVAIGRERRGPDRHARAPDAAAARGAAPAAETEATRAGAPAAVEAGVHGCPPAAASGSQETRSRRSPGDALERVGGARSTSLGVESRLSTGLARPDLYNWYTRFNQLIAGCVRRWRCCRSAPTTPTTTWQAFRAERASAARHAELGRGVPAAGRRGHARAERGRDQDGLARPADPGRAGLPPQLPDRQLDPRLGRRASSHATRSTSTRGTCSTAPTASTPPTCA